jgi:hypothetical protein
VYSNWSQTWIDGDRHLLAATDGTWVYFLGMTLYGYLGRARISDGAFETIGSHEISNAYYSGIAWDGTSVLCTITTNAFENVGYWQKFTYNTGTSSWDVPGGATSHWATRGIAATSSQIYMAHACEPSYVAYGPVTIQTGIPAAQTKIGSRATYRFSGKIFTDGIWLYGFGISNNTLYGDSYWGTLYTVK